jgi:uncharacterized membrane protein YidH (DUF202 family)
MADFNLVFLFLFVLIIGALAVSNFVEAQSKGQQQPYQSYMATVYLLIALGLVVFKVASR